MTDRTVILAVLGLAQVTVGCSAFKASTTALSGATPFRVRPFEWEEATVAQLQAAMKSAKVTAASVVKQYLRRIEEVDRSGHRSPSFWTPHPGLCHPLAGERAHALRDLVEHLDEPGCFSHVALT